MKLALVTICCGEYFERLAALTHPPMQAYADRIGAEFIVWRDFPGHTMPHYQKLEIGKLLDRYDRVLYLDTDILVRDDAPDLFAMVPEDQLGALLESQYFSRCITFWAFMMSVGFDVRLWDGNYYNTGVLVLSKQHRNLFEPPPEEWDHFKEQSFLNLMRAGTRTPVFPLPHRCNRMYTTDHYHGEPWWDSYLIHYAGMYLTHSEEQVLQLVARHQAEWERAKPRYKFAKRLAFVLRGGLAEHLAAEPAIRYARQVLHPDDDLVIVSGYPQLFAHLPLPVHATLAAAPQAEFRKQLCNAIQRSARPATVYPWKIHKTTYAALTMLGLELPLAGRQPRLLVNRSASESLSAKLGAVPLDVLVHPHNAIDALPTNVAVWQATIDALVADGLRVVLVGNRDQNEFKVAALNAAGCLDLVDQLSLDEIIALTSLAAVAVVSDPAMVQIAGAFDNWIGLLGGVQNPEYVLPWRRGTPWYRARAFGRCESRDDVQRVVQFVRQALQGSRETTR